MFHLKWKKIFFRGILSTFPTVIGTTVYTQYSVYLCPILTDDYQAPIGFCHYSNIVDTVQSSSGTVISYMYRSPKHIQGQYSFYESNGYDLPTSATQNAILFIEFRKYN